MESRVIKICGLKSLEIYHKRYKNEKPILIIDSFDNVDIENSSESNLARGTLMNVCYTACKITKKYLKFVYIAIPKPQFSSVWNSIKTKDWKGVIFHDKGLCEPLSRPFSEKQLCFFKVDDLLCTLSVSLFGTLGKFEKGGGGPNILGFVLKSYVQIADKPFHSLNPIVSPQVRIIDTVSRFKKALTHIKSTNLVSIDTETGGLDRITSPLLSVQFGINNSLAYCLPMEGHSECPWTFDELNLIKKELKLYFSTTDSTHLMHYSIFDIGQLCHHFDIKFYNANVYDTIAAEQAIDENLKFLNKKNQYSSYSLEVVELRYGLVRPQGLIEKDQRHNMASFSLKEIAEYGSYDVTTLFDIKNRQEESCTHPLVGYNNIKDFNRVIIKQLGATSRVIATMQNNGMKIDTNYLINLVNEKGPLAKERDSIIDNLFESENVKKLNRRLLKRKGLSKNTLFGGNEDRLFDINKPSHKTELFFDIMRLEPINYGKSLDKDGNPVPSADKSFQKVYAPQTESGDFLSSAIPEVVALIKYSKISKLKTAFVDSIAERIVSDQDFIKDGRLRSSYGFTSVLGGRLNSYAINMQQIPSRGSLSKVIKKAFISETGKVLIGSDFSAHEVRVGGIIAKDKVVESVFKAANEAIREFRLSKITTPEELTEAKKILEKKGDIHLLNIKFFYGLEVDKKHPLRDQIKAIVFGVLYGKMAKNLAKSLNIEESEAQELLDKLFTNWYGVKNWIDQSHKRAQETFQYLYPNNRIRHLWGYLSADEWVHFAMNRRAINSPVQGFASDIGVIGIDELNRYIDRNIWRKGLNFDFKSINMIHDAQYSETLFEHLPLAVYLTEHAMSSLPMNFYKNQFNYTINIPLSYDLDIGTDWSSLKEWDKRSSSLFEIIKEVGAKLNKSVDKVIEDAKIIMKVREAELRENPYQMRLNDTNSYEFFSNKLNMFKD